MMRVQFRSALLTLAAAAAFAQEPPPGGLKAHLSHFAVTRKSLPEALMELARRIHSTTVIGFEYVTRVPTQLIDVTVDDGTVEDALAAMCSDGRYAYSEALPGIVNVRPVQEPVELRALMELPVPKLDLEDRIWPFNLIAQVAVRVPQLRQYLTDQVLEWSRRTGQPPPGSPGWGMITNDTPPLIPIHLENTTIRGVLNAFSAASMAISSDDRLSERYGILSGWSVEFIPDPNAPTGLGGYVRWMPFPHQ